MTLQEVIAKLERWEDNLRTNAKYYDEQGTEETGTRCLLRAQDLHDAIAMLREVK